MSSTNDLIETEIFYYKCPCDEGVMGSFVRYYSKGQVQCPHCFTYFDLKDMTKIQHQR
jgi:hypothetical protein